MPALANPRPRRWTPSDGVTGRSGKGAVGSAVGGEPLVFILASKLGIGLRSDVGP